MVIRLCCLAAAFFFLFSSGCSRPQNEDEIKPVAQPITDDDANQFRLAFDTVIQAKAKQQFVALFSKPDLFARIFEDIELSAVQQRALESKINRGGNLGEIANSLFSRLVFGARYDFVRIERVDNQVSLIYRFVFKNLREIEYHRIELVRDSRNKIRAGDLFYYLEERSLVSGLRQSVLKELLLSGELKSKSGRDLASEIRVDPRQSDAYRKCLELTVEKKWNEVWKVMEDLPEEIKQTSVVQLHRMQVSAMIDRELFSKTFEKTKKASPENIRVDFQAIGFFQRHQEYDKVVEVVDAIFEKVKDPFVRMLKINPLIRLGKLKDAREIIEEFKAMSGTSILLLKHEFELAVGENKFELCISLLDRLKDEFGLEHGNLSKLPRYAELLKSPEYKEWKSSREKEPEKRKTSENESTESKTK